ncbi:MAG: PAS domain-containing protein, partial [Marinilabiliales bacterium]|nr:PAS domain-containing protein [Marinilabiliales bacterium]
LRIAKVNPVTGTQDLAPVFAIDKTGVIILWNNAIEQLTGYRSGDMIGKGNREYAIPFFGELRPMLVDYIAVSTDKRLSGKFPE